MIDRLGLLLVALSRRDRRHRDASHLGSNLNRLLLVPNGLGLALG